jgi:5-methylcytosine-specific restriction protein A
MAKDKDYIKLINTARWQQLRKAVLTAHPICQECEKAGRLEAATEVHHVRPVEEAVFYTDKQQRMFDLHNLQALCHDCHVRIHTQLGRSGKEATKKRNHDLTEQVIKKFFEGDED